MDEQYNEFGLKVFLDLNGIFIEAPPERYPDKYSHLCNVRFASIEGDVHKNQIASDLFRRYYYYQIDMLIPARKIENKEEIITELKNGNLYITEYGRAFIDRMDVVNLINNGQNSLKQFILNEKMNIEKLKDNTIIQVITLMGVFIAIIVFIFQGIWLTTKTDFLDKCFIQQIASVFAFYLPLLITIIFIISGCYLFLWIKNKFKSNGQ